MKQKQMTLKPSEVRFLIDVVSYFYAIEQARKTAKITQKRAMTVLRSLYRQGRRQK